MSSLVFCCLLLFAWKLHLLEKTPGVAASRFIALSLRSFAFENSIVSEVGWDLGLALKELSLGNGINKGHVLVPQNTCDVAIC